MRVFLAGLFVMTVVFGTAGLLSSWYGDAAPLWMRLFVYGVLAVTIFIAMQFFNRPGYRPGDYRKNPGEMRAMLARWNLLVRETFRANRAFRVEPFGSLGPVYLVELIDGRVLYLRGQYLYEYEPVGADPDDPGDTLRRFPCTEFEIVRHRVTGDVIEFNCAGRSFEPEFSAPALPKSQLKQKMSRDGAILLGSTYDDLKREYQGGAA